MPAKCSFYKCPNSRQNSHEGLRFFKFPKERALQWANHCGNPDLIGLSPSTLSRNRIVCEDHFRPEQIFPSGRLFPGALPIPFTQNEPSTSGGSSPYFKVTKVQKTYLREYSSNQYQNFIPLPELPDGDTESVNHKTVEILTPSTRSQGEAVNELITTPSGSFSVEKRSSSTWIETASSPSRPKTKRALFVEETSSKSVKQIESMKKMLNKRKAQVHYLKHSLIKAKKEKKAGKRVNIPLKSKEASTLINMQFHKSRKPWNKSEKKFALGLYLRSPSGYCYLQQFINLPGLSTIKMWLGEHKILKTGFRKEMMEKIKIKASSMNAKEKACVLMFDGMSIKQHLQYSQPQDLIEGYQDVGPFGREPVLGKQATVIMVRGLYYQWKLPVAYFITESTIPGEKMCFLIEKAIENLSAAGLCVKAVVCDQGTSNTKAYNDLGASVNTPFFMNSKNEKVFTFYDTPHLIKSLRNNFLTHDFIYEGERVSFADVKELYELECKSTTTRAAHQLTPAHIWPNNFQKMNVSLATQVFSHTTSAALKTAVATGQIQSETAEHTAKFLSDINSLYDAMNSRRLKTTNPDSCALSTKNQHVMDVIKQGIEIFKNLKKINAKYPRPPCFSGFVTTLTATLQLLNSENCKYLLTSRLNQDPLENLFSSIRQRGGFNRNPSVRVFRGNLRVFTLKQMMVPPKTTSYDPDEDELLEIETSPEKMSTEQTSAKMPTVPSHDEDEIEFLNISMASEEETVSFSNSTENVVSLEKCSQVYFAGYLAHHHYKKFKCKECLVKQIDPHSELKSTKELLLLNRSFSNFKIDITSGLFSPSESLLFVVDTALKIFTLKFKELAHKENLIKTFVQMTESCVALESLTCSQCSTSNELLSTLFRVLIHKQCKWLSANMKSKSLDKIKVLKNV